MVDFIKENGTEVQEFKDRNRLVRAPFITENFKMIKLMDMVVTIMTMAIFTSALSN